ncbi:feruloyl esterase B precursor [Xylogone sp. PMI_703]|nr:feruloyl esterase B precursor [Xylogone sp. PMI_703]
MSSFRRSAALAAAALQSTSLFTPTLALPTGGSGNLPCDDNIPFPDLPGAQILSIKAFPVTNYSNNITGLDFCNVTVTYTHPGEGDNINAYYWLPPNWNGRFMGNGGGGFATGAIEATLALAAVRGYSAGGTDGGHINDTLNAEPWADVSPGNVNLYLLQDFASVALNDMTIIGKQLSQSFYGTAPSFSYWNGCSTGGRQGLMIAQRYPTAYDGILAGAPAINWAKFIIAEYWPQFTMNQLNYFPSPCELAAIQAAAISACDSLDGVTDGIISRPDLCHFDPTTVVGHTASCPDGTTTTITADGAKVALATWTGPIDANGKHLWWGLIPGSPFTGLAGTTCENGVCSTAPFPITTQWIDLFVVKNESFDVTKMTLQQYTDIFHDSFNEFASIIGTSDPDLAQFKRAGGKMITWHGLADELIFPNGTVHYYNRVEKLFPDVRDFYRFYEAPGVNHCGGGLGAYPGTAIDQLVDWVEKGVAPDTLQAKGTGLHGQETNLNLCLFPKLPIYQGGDPNSASSYKCKKV